MCIHTLPVDIHCVNAWHASVSFLLGWKSPDTLPCSNAGSLPWETVPHELFQCGPFPEAAVFPKLLRHGSFQRLQSFSNRLLQRGSPQAPKSCQQSCSSVGFSLHGTTSFLLHGVTASFGYLPAPVWVPHGMQVDLSSTMTSVGCQVASCLSMIFPMGCKGFSCPSFPTDLGSAGLFLSRSHSSAAAALAQQHSYSLQCYSRCTPTVADGLIHGQWWVHPGAL